MGRRSSHSRYSRSSRLASRAPRDGVTVVKNGKIVHHGAEPRADRVHPQQARIVESAVVPIPNAQGIYVARTYAYVAAGTQGLVIVDVERPEAPKIDQVFSAAGAINDARDVKVAMTNASVFGYVADGRNGLRVVQLVSANTTPGAFGFSPRPAPTLIATYKTHGPALAISKGLDRDRAVDESGHQIAVFGRRGARPFTLEEMQRMYLRNGRVWTVTDDEPGAAPAPGSASSGRPAQRSLRAPNGRPVALRSVR